MDILVEDLSGADLLEACGWDASELFHFNKKQQSLGRALTIQVFLCDNVTGADIMNTLVTYSDIGVYQSVDGLTCLEDAAALRMV
jgi:hypothetical protein